MSDGRLCEYCREVRPLTAFKLNRVGTTARRICKRCAKRKERRKNGCRLRTEMHANRRIKVYARRTSPRCNLIRDHPDREWARQYRNGLFRAKYARDPDAERQRMQVYKQAHPEIAGRHRGGRNRLAAARSSDGTLTREILRDMISRATTCEYCGCNLAETKKSFEHKIPLSRGGKHSIANVIVACWPCNRAKHALTPEEWAARRRSA